MSDLWIDVGRADLEGRRCRHDIADLGEKGLLGRWVRGAVRVCLKPGIDLRLERIALREAGRVLRGEVADDRAEARPEVFRVDARARGNFIANQGEKFCGNLEAADVNGFSHNDDLPCLGGRGAILATLRAQRKAMGPARAWGRKEHKDMQQGVYYGWKVVAALFVMLTFTSGLAFYNMSVLMNALVSTGRYPVSIVSAGVALFFVASGSAGMIAAPFLQRYDPRWTLAFGGVLGALALLALGHAPNLLALYGALMLFGVGHACSALVPATTLVARWFSARRSVALSITSTGLSLGGILLTPVAASLITRLGLEASVPWLAAAWFLGIVPITALVVRGPRSGGRGTASCQCEKPEPPTRRGLGLC